MMSRIKMVISVKKIQRERTQLAYFLSKMVQYLYFLIKVLYLVGHSV